jgi:undecaprenyl diphosphate synthase
MTMAKRDRQARVPKHVACVMDGNGRWAEQRGLTRSEGHAALEGAMIETALAAADLGIEWLTVYAFSTENWNRPEDEVAFLMRLNESILVRRTAELDARGIRVRFMGRPDPRIPETLAAEMARVADATARNRGLTFTIAFNYGGRAELIDAMRRMRADGVSPDSVDEGTVRRYLYAPDMPDPDLVIRTSGEFRVSNFLLWELAYSELVFTDVLWPDFGRAELVSSINQFGTRTRRFGKVLTPDPRQPQPAGAARR